MMRGLKRLTLLLGVFLFAGGAWSAERIPKDVHIYLDYSRSIVGSGKANAKLAEMMTALLSYRGEGRGEPFLGDGDRVFIQRFGERLYPRREYEARETQGWRETLKEYGEITTGADGITNMAAVIDDLRRLQDASTENPRAQVALIASDFVHDGNNDACARGLPEARARQPVVAQGVEVLSPVIPQLGSGVELPFTVGLLYVFDRSPYANPKMTERARNVANRCFATMLEESVIRKALEGRFSTESVSFQDAQRDIPAFVQGMSRRIDDAISLPLRVVDPRDVQAERLADGRWGVRLELHNPAPIAITQLGARFLKEAAGTSPVSAAVEQMEGPTVLGPGERRSFTFPIPAELSRTLLGGPGFSIETVDSVTKGSTKQGARVNVGSPGRRELELQGDATWPSPLVPDATGNIPLTLTLINREVRENRPLGLILSFNQAGLDGMRIPISGAKALGAGDALRVRVPIPINRFERHILEGVEASRTLYFRVLDQTEVAEESRKLHSIALPATQSLRVTPETKARGSGDGWTLPVVFSIGEEFLPERIVSAEVFRSRGEEQGTPLGFDPVKLEPGAQARQVLSIPRRIIIPLQGEEKFFIRFRCVRCAEPLWLEADTPETGSVELVEPYIWGKTSRDEGDDGRLESTTELTLSIENRGDIINEVSRIVAFPQSGRGEGERVLSSPDGARISIAGKETKQIRVRIPERHWEALFLGERFYIQLYQVVGNREEQRTNLFPVMPPRPAVPLASHDAPSWATDSEEGGYQLVVPLRNTEELPNILRSATLIDIDSKESISLSVDQLPVWKKGARKDMVLALPREQEGSLLLVRPGLHLVYRDLSHDPDGEGALIKVPPVSIQEATVKGWEALPESDNQPAVNPGSRSLKVRVHNDQETPVRVDGLAFYRSSEDSTPFMEYRGGRFTESLYLAPKSYEDVTLTISDEKMWNQLRENNWTLIRAFTTETFAKDPTGKSGQRIATAVLPVDILTVDKQTFPGAAGGMVATLRFQVRNKRDRVEKHTLSAHLINTEEPDRRIDLKEHTIEFQPEESLVHTMTVEVHKEDLRSLGDLRKAAFELKVKDTPVTRTVMVIDGEKEWHFWQFKHVVLLALMLGFTTWLFWEQRKQLGRMSALANSVQLMVTVAPLVPLLFIWVFAVGVEGGMTWVAVAGAIAPLVTYIAVGRRLRRDFPAQLRRLMTQPEHHRTSLNEVAHRLKGRHRWMALGAALVVAVVWMELFAPYGVSLSNYLLPNLG